MKVRVRQNRVSIKSAGRKALIAIIRDWVGFFLTVAGVLLSLTGGRYIEVQYYVTMEVHNYYISTSEAEWKDPRKWLPELGYCNDYKIANEFIFLPIGYKTIDIVLLEKRYGRERAKEMFNIAKNQKHYTPEFKQQIMDLYNMGGTSYPQLEHEYSVNRSTYYKALVCVPSNREKNMKRSVVVKKYNHHANHGTVPDHKKHIESYQSDKEMVHSFSRKGNSYDKAYIDWKLSAFYKKGGKMKKSRFSYIRRTLILCGFQSHFVSLTIINQR